MKKLLIPLVAVALALGCADAPTGTDGLTPNFKVAGNSGCYIVNFTVHSTLDFGTLPELEFNGKVSGDLAGTNRAVFDLSTFVITGVKTRVKATVTWDVTHADMGPLGFVTLANGGFTVDPNDPDITVVHSTERALSGVRKANLNDSGTITAGGTVADLQYNGVICP